MSTKYAVYRQLADIDKDPPVLTMTRWKFEAGVANGRFQRITDHKALLICAPSCPNANSGALASRHELSTAANRQSPKTSGACQICGFDRYIEKTHIIPARFEGPREPHNLLDLCPNHHTLFDSNRLTWDEMAKIWPFVCEALLRTLGDQRLDEWRKALGDKYGVSFDAS